MPTQAGTTTHARNHRAQPKRPKAGANTTNVGDRDAAAIALLLLFEFLGLQFLFLGLIFLRPAPEHLYTSCQIEHKHVTSQIIARRGVC